MKFEEYGIERYDDADGMTPCLFCRQPVQAGDIGITEWHGDLCHAACSDWLTQAASDFKPVPIKEHGKYRPDHVPATYAWCGAAFQDLDFEWPELEDKLKEKLYTRYLETLTKLLDNQELVIKAYCKRHGLPDPKIIRELKQSSQHMIEMYRSMRCEDMLPGDHFVMAILPRSQYHKWHSAQLVRNIATRFSENGVTFHSAFVGLDWSKPVAQQAVRMALNIQKWQQSIFKDQMEYEKGSIRRLFGYTWGQIQNHQLFQWVVRHIRDKKMSPAEVWNASRKYWMVTAFVHQNKKWWVTMITKDRFLAYEQKKKQHYYCGKHKIVSALSKCRTCGAICQPVKTWAMQGCFLNPRRRLYDSDEMYMRMWAFYCEHHPEQEKTPWESRSRFPEILKLKDVKIEIAEDGFDKE